MRQSTAFYTREQLLTLADIARHFNLPESTARYYCKRFAEFIPAVGEGRRRRYRRESLEVVAAVLDHMRTARTAAGVEDALNRQFPRTTEALTPVREKAPVPSMSSGFAENALPAVAMRLLEQQTRAMEGIAAALNMLAHHQENLRKLEDDARGTAAENDALRREVADLRTLLHSAEKIHQNDLEQLRVWMGRALRMRGKAPDGSGE